jgi:predicted nucleic acid-binding protein
MPFIKKIADSGLLIAALDGGDEHHAWARRALESYPPPWLVCESVLAEVSASVGSPVPVLEMLVAGDLEIAFQIEEQAPEVLALTRKYRDQNMDLADACVVRMSEILDATVFTVDKKDFSVYRRHSRQKIPCVFPD